ncbi:MAG: DEAD/DEAH box helicase, partial [Planctomycetota bacterium]
MTSGLSPSRFDFHQGTVRIHADIDPTDSDVPLVWDDRQSCFLADAIHAPRLRKDYPDLIDHTLENQSALPLIDKRDIRLRRDQLDACDAFLAGAPPTRDSDASVFESEQATSGGRGLVIMPTGTGKTVVAMELILRYQLPTLVVVPVRDLMYQWHSKILQATGVDAGLMGDGIHRVSPMCVTTYDSAAIHMPRVGDRFGFLIFDEVHHLSGAWRSDSARMSVAGIRLGLTATPPSDPQRRETLQHLVGPIVYQQQIQQAAGKSLADYVVRRISVRMLPEEEKRYRELSRTVQQFVHDQRGIDADFRWEQIFGLTAAVDENPARAIAANSALRAFRAKTKIEENADGKLRVLEDLFRLHRDEPVIVFTGSNVMARQISQRFLVPCLLSHCGKKERRHWLEGFAEGRYPVLVANRVLDEGVDLP